MRGAPVEARRRSMLLGGLQVMAGRPGAVAWTYVASLTVALLFSLGLHAKLSDVLDHSLAAERLNSAFDLGTVGAVYHRLAFRAPSQGAAGQYAGLPVYFLIYFLLVPGALLAYRVGGRARLAGMLSGGLCFFWRFARITLLTVLVSAIVLGPLMALQAAWAAHMDEHVVGVAALYYTMPGWLLIFLAASILRLYFDLVEVYAVQLDSHSRPNGRPDRRVRKTLMPAAKVLWRNLPRALGSFVLIAVVGLAILFVAGRVAVHTLAQPRVWPAFLLVQMGMFACVATRYWQRGAETILAGDNPLPLPVFQAKPLDQEILEPNRRTAAVEPWSISETAHPERAERGRSRRFSDAQPGPEPASPSLSEPDEGIFRREPPAEV